MLNNNAKSCSLHTCGACPRKLTNETHLLRTKPQPLAEGNSFSSFLFTVDFSYSAKLTGFSLKK